MIIGISFLVTLFVLSMCGMYLVKDYYNDIIYKGIIGKLQKLFIK